MTDDRYAVYPQPKFSKNDLRLYIELNAPDEFGPGFARYLTDEIWPYCLTGTYETPRDAVRAKM